MVKTLFRKLRSSMPKPIRKAAFRAARFLGSGLYPVYPSIDGTLKYLREWGFKPAAVIDVGAYHGLWTELFRSIFPGAKSLMIEGQEAKAAALREFCAKAGGDVTFETALLGARDGETVRFVEMETGSSVLEEASPYARNYVERTLTTLDSVLARHPAFQKADFLKLDVQGYELDVLRGASAALQKAEFVLMEASLIPINRGCPLISEVIDFMSSRDFRLLDFCSQSRLPPFPVHLRDPPRPPREHCSRETQNQNQPLITQTFTSGFTSACSLIATL